MIWVMIVLKNKSVRDKSLNFLSVDEKNLEQKKRGFKSSYILTQQKHPKQVYTMYTL